MKAVIMTMGALASFAVIGADAVLRGEDSWSGRPRHIAVVNAVGAEGDENILSLRGEWDFIAQANGRSGPPCNLPLSNHAWPFYLWTSKFVDKEAGGAWKIKVPACWESQGVGTVTTGKPWRCHDQAPHRIHGFTGDAWYHREVKVPASWAGKRIWLKVGGVNSQGRFWVNDRPVVMVSTYCGTYKWEITDLVGADGRVKIVASVSNSEPSRRGLYNSENRWGGIIRDVELEATPDVFIDDAWVRGDFDRQVAEVHVEIAGKREEGRGKRLRVTVEGETVEAALDNQAIRQSGNQAILKIALRNFRPWSPEHPNLYWATVELLEDGKVVQTRKERFGVRKIESRGDQFYLNGRPFYFRGVGWHAVDPIHGEVPADREYIRKIVRRIREAGFNAVRFHTHCKSPECFEVADELGLLIQPELPYYNDWTSDYFAFDPLGDALELWRNYRRYPSFAVYCGGNEGDFGPVLSSRLYAEIKRRDPDRLVYGQDAVTTPVVGEKIKALYGLDDAHVPPDGTWLWNGPDASDFIGGPTMTWPRGSFEYGRPFVCHEYLNLTVKSDARLEDRFSGVWLPPITRAERTAWLAKFGLDDVWGDRLQDAQHALQKYWIKYGLECARADPHCDGYSYWSLQDTSVHASGTVTAQGLFNPFLEEKPCGTTVADCQAFNAPTCVLLDRELGSYEEDFRAKGKAFVAETNFVFRSGAKMPFKILLQHYGEAPLEAARLRWEIVADGRRLADGARDLGTQAIGPTRTVESVDFVVPAVERPVKAVLTATVAARSDGADVAQANSWPLWFYPSDFPTAAVTRKRAAASGVTIGTAGSEAVEAAIAAGGRVISVVPPENEPNVELGWWWMGSQVGMVFASHPALKDLPHDGVLSPLFFRIVKKGALKLPLEGVRAEDLLIVGEGRDACYAYLAERRHANGAREMIVSGLDLESGTPEGDALFKGLVEWLQQGDPAAAVPPVNAGCRAYDANYRSVDTNRAMARLERLWRHEVGQTMSCKRRAAETVVGYLRADGFSNVESLELPTDGRTSCQDKRMPFAWEATVGRLTVVDRGNRVAQECLWASAEGDAAVVADYAVHPFHLVKGSTATPPGGVIAKVLSEARFLAGEDAKGALVMLEPDTWPRAPMLTAVLDRGGLGFISDQIVDRFETPDSIQWVTACTETSSWSCDEETRPFVGFSVSPRVGTQLRSMAAAGGVKVRVECDGRRVATTMPFVTATVPGRRPEEFWLVAHMYEPLASDDSCGVTAAIELARRYVGRTPPTYTVRVLFGIEYYGYAAYLDRLGCPLRPRVVGALNLDSIPCQRDTYLDLLLAGPATPFCGNLVLESLADSLDGEPHALKAVCRRYGEYFDDYFMSDPTVGVPLVGTLYGFSGARYWHNSRMDVDFMDPEIYRRSIAFAATFMDRLVNPSADLVPEALACARRRLARAAQEAGSAEHFRHLAGIERRQLADFDRVIGPGTATAALADFDAEAARLARTVKEGPKTDSPWRRAAAGIVPARRETGVTQDLTKVPRTERIDIPGTVIYAPLGNVFMNIDGKKDLARLIREAEYESGTPLDEETVASYVRAISFLGDWGYLSVSNAHAVTAADVVRALTDAGVRRGDFLLVDADVDAIGPVVGGAKAVLSALREAVGPDGTVLLPSFTPSVRMCREINRSWDYRPYDPKDLVSVARSCPLAATLLRTDPSAIRSAHYVRSWAGFGPQAAAALGAQRPDAAPYDGTSPLAKARTAGGKLVRIGPPAAATDEVVRFFDARRGKGARETAVVGVRQADGSSRDAFVPDFPVPEEKAAPVRDVSARRVPLGLSDIGTVALDACEEAWR